MKISLLIVVYPVRGYSYCNCLRIILYGLCNDISSLLERVRSSGKRWRASYREELKFEFIHLTIKTYKLKRLARYLCDVIEVSRSGAYNYFSEKSVQKRVAKAKIDEIVKGIILKAYHFLGRKKEHVKSK